MSSVKALPTFDELPLLDGDKDWPGCAWGLWGPDDELGTVNLLTQENLVQVTKEEIK